jgi:hypothetical protein
MLTQITSKRGCNVALLRAPPVNEKRATLMYELGHEPLIGGFVLPNHSCQN